MNRVKPKLRRKVTKGKPCAYCQRRMPHMTVDHSVPVSRGGKQRNNLVPCCLECNRRKGILTASEFRYGLVDAQIAGYSGRHAFVRLCRNLKSNLNTLIPLQ